MGDPNVEVRRVKTIDATSLLWGALLAAFFCLLLVMTRAGGPGDGTGRYQLGGPGERFALVIDTKTGTVYMVDTNVMRSNGRRPIDLPYVEREAAPGNRRPIG